MSSCQPTPCDEGTVCAGTLDCCAASCCGVGTICCNQVGGVFAGPECTAPIDDTCPGGCHDCP